EAAYYAQRQRPAAG
ncbi:transposase, partial [Mycobacterium tuberculosis BTB09-485]